jgi:cell wall-associated NlpC family hydrolase
MQEPATQRNLVVREARSWLGTPYHHRGMLKGIGVDCAQFPMLVYSSCGLFPAFKTGDYPPDWHLHRNEERYLLRVSERAREIPETALEPGDFALFRVGRCYAHGAIVTRWPTIIHAVIDRAVILDTANGGRLGTSARKFFTLW